MEEAASDIHAYVYKGTLYIKATNIQEFKNLIQQAEKQTKVLQEIIVKISSFDIELKLEAE